MQPRSVSFEVVIELTNSSYKQSDMVSTLCLTCQSLNSGLFYMSAARWLYLPPFHKLLEMKKDK